MQIQVTGKNISVGDALRQHVEERLNGDVARYFDGTVSAHVTVEKQRSQFRSECTLRLATGMVLQAHGIDGDARMAFDTAANHLEKRLRRYKGRLRDHHNRRRKPVAPFDVRSFVIQASADEEAREEPSDLNPVIVAEDLHQVPELAVGEAAMQLDISNLSFLLFRNAKNNSFGLVYRRDDGNIGWIDLASADKSTAD
jgi:ribosome hibernation promoting factor